MYDLFKNLLNHAEGAADGAAGDTGENAAPDAKEEVKYVYGIEESPEGGAKQEEAKTETWEDVKKRFAKEYGADVQGAVQKRFAGMTKIKDSLGRANELLARTAERYKIQVNEDGSIDYDKLEAAMDDDDEQYEALADELGVSVEFAKERAKQQRQLKKLERAELQRQQEAKNYAMFQRHQQQAEALKKDFPSFDLLTEMDNHAFVTMLDSGFSVEDAFYTVHRKELMKAGQHVAAKQAAEELTASIMAGQSRPAEGGLQQTPTTRTERLSDPSKLTRAQRREINKIAARGGKIAF